MSLFRKIGDCILRPHQGLGCDLLHDFGHSVTAGVIVAFARLALHSWSLALFIACIVWPLVQEGTDYWAGPRLKFPRDSVHDLATYQLPLAVYLGWTGYWVPAVAIVMLMAVDVLLYYNWRNS